MSVWNAKMKEEENINKKKLLFDGHGTGVDKRLMTMLKDVTKFCLIDEPLDQISNSYNQVSKSLSLCILDAERTEIMLDVCRKDLSKTIETIQSEEYEIEKAKLEIERARLDLEYEKKVKVVNELPDCNHTEMRIKALEEKQVALLERMAKHKQQLQRIVDVCDEFERILSDDSEGATSDYVESTAMHVD